MTKPYEACRRAVSLYSSIASPTFTGGQHQGDAEGSDGHPGGVIAEEAAVVAPAAEVRDRRRGDKAVVAMRPAALRRYWGMSSQAQL